RSGFRMGGTGGWRTVDVRQGLASDTTSCALADREGSVWIGFAGAGLTRWLGYNEWESWTRAEGLASDNILSVVRDASGTMWAATSAGLERVGGPRAAARFTDGTIRTLAATGDGDLWVAISGRGFSRFHPGTSTTPKIQAFPSVRHMLPVSDGSVWLTTESGIHHSREGRIERVFGDPGEQFYESLRARDGTLWFGSSRGLVRFREGAWTRIPPSEGIRGTHVVHLAETPDGALWFGYRDALGLSAITRGGIVHLTTREGLASNQISFLRTDARGNLWAGHDRGVDVLSGGRWRHYGEPEGLIWAHCNVDAFLADPDGSVWIGTSRGLAHYRPAANSDPDRALPV
ncbi:MAG: ligand-binding sensor domain-containing protein, partial [Bryobacteraceae bacterium]